MGILTTIVQGIGKKIKDYRQQRNIRSVISKHEGILTNAFKQIIFEEGHIYYFIKPTKKKAVILSPSV